MGDIRPVDIDLDIDPAVAETAVGFVGTAGFADFAGIAGFAETAGFVDSAETADSAGFVDFAGSAEPVGFAAWIEHNRKPVRPQAFFRNNCIA